MVNNLKMHNHRHKHPWTGLKIAQKNCVSNDIFPQYGYKRSSIYNFFMFMKFIVKILTNVQHNNQVIKGCPNGFNKASVVKEKLHNDKAKSQRVYPYIV